MDVSMYGLQFPAKMCALNTFKEDPSNDVSVIFWEDAIPNYDCHIILIK